jgi:hypothetical protein
MFTKTVVLIVVACPFLAGGSVRAGEKVRFTSKPAAQRVAGKVKIRFTVSAPTDVAVYIEDARGEVIRHLVAGVLGPRAPAPLKPGLSQELEWDGKANYGKPAAGGPFKVRVGLGLGARYDKVAHSILPDLKDAAAIVMAPDGRLYVSYSKTGWAATDRWRIFGRDGRYQGTLGFPPTAAAARYFGWALPGGQPDPIKMRKFKHITAAWLHTAVYGSQAAVISKDGKDMYHLNFSNPISINRYPLTADIPRNDRCQVPIDAEKVKGLVGFEFGAAPCLASSSDGKSLYMGGLVGSTHRKAKAMPAVYAVDCPSRKNARVLFGDISKTGNDQSHLGGDPKGLVVDGKGRLYVSDQVNNRIVVVSENDGKYIGAIPCPRPGRLGFSQKTGSLYVIASERRQSLRRFKPSGDAGTLGSLKPEVSAMLRNYKRAHIAVDDSASPTVVWVGGGWHNIIRFEDSGSGDKFAKRESPKLRSSTSKGPQEKIAFSNVHVDRIRKEVYFRNGNNGASNGRFVEATGKVENIDVRHIGIGGGGVGIQMVPGFGNSLYGSQFPNRLYRWSRDGKALAWKDKRVLTAKDAAIGNRPLKLKRQAPHLAWMPVAMGVLPHNLGVRWSDGHLFSIEPYRWLGKSVGGRTHKALQEYLPGGERVTTEVNPVIWKLSDAAVGPKFDALGNIYIAEAVRPANWIMPAELAAYFKSKGIKVAPNGERGKSSTRFVGSMGNAARTYGSILKFSPRGGMVHLSRQKRKSPNAVGADPFVGEPKLDASLKTVTVDYVSGNYLRIGLKVTGTEWIHPGIGHVGFFACNCENVTFDVDEFGRTFFGDTLQHRIKVIDTAGNSISHFGGYGDANYMGPDSPVLDSKTNRFRPRRKGDPASLTSPFAQPELAFSWIVGVGVTDKYIYIGDSKNHRLLRAKKVYAAEETCAISAGR